MTNASSKPAAVDLQIETLLTSAIVLSWDDLQTEPQGLMHIEFVPGSSIPFVKIWNRTGKGEWSLICEYWITGHSNPTGMAGPSFSNGYHSAGLAGMLEFIMRHQSHFIASRVRPGGGMIQVTTPSEAEVLAATACMKQAYERQDKKFEPAPLTAVA